MMNLHLMSPRRNIFRWLAISLSCGICILRTPHSVQAQSVWQQASRNTDQQLAQAAYDRAISDGDDALVKALSGEQPRVKRAKAFYVAINFYRAAALAQPTDTAPYLRISHALEQVWIQCETDKVPWCLKQQSFFSTKAGRELADVFGTLQQLSPNDVRVNNLANSMAVIFTRLHTPADLARAAELYQRTLQQEPEDATAKSNLAEVYMMMQQLDRAIELYRDVVAKSGDTSTVIGLAVAMDRSGQPKAARRLLSRLTEDNVNLWENAIAGGDTFYVPEGEVHYYRALIAEVRGDAKSAEQLWTQFIASGANPAFAATAAANRKALSTQHKQPSQLAPATDGF
jgi:tetratricopeptide (TPR) repeat protein